MSGIDSSDGGKCGFVPDQEGELRGYVGTSCWRDPMPESERCVWHADPSDKTPADVWNALEEALEKGTVVYDGANLSGMALGRIYLPDGCSLIAADLSDAKLVRANLSGVDFYGANLSDATIWLSDLSNSDFRDVDLSQAVVSDTNLSETDLSRADLSSTSFQKSNLSDTEFQANNFNGTQFSRADLTDAFFYNSNLSDVNFSRSHLIKTVLYDTDLTNADLRWTNLTDADFTDSTVSGANLEQSTLTRTNLFDADLKSAKFYGAVFHDVRVNHGTEFGDHYEEEIDDEEADPDADPSPWDKAAFCYRQIEELAQTRALPKQAREAYRARKGVRRREQWKRAPIPGPIRRVAQLKDYPKDEGALIRAANTVDPDETIRNGLRSRWNGLAQVLLWAQIALSGATTRYADSFRRVIRLSAAVILSFGLLFPFFGGMKRQPASDATAYAFTSLIPVSISVPEWLEVLWFNIYFSGVTFTTLGYGDIQPATPAVEFLATIESFVGALLMALLVFVLGRRTTW